MDASSIASVGRIERLAPPRAVAADSGAGSASVTPVTAEVQQRFADLMSQHREHGRSTRAGRDHDAINALTSVLEAQQSGMNATHQRIMDVMDRSPDMSMGEAVLAGAEVAMMTATLKMRMDLAEGITQSSNKSLQSLLKNE